MPRRESVGDTFQKFLDVVVRLRKECPWDREQTHQSIRHSLIEETYEVIEAIDSNRPQELKNELGDLLLHVAFHSAMADEEKTFDMRDVLDSITEKLIRRHPHVFGATRVENANDVKAHWEKIKMSEGRESVLDGVPKELPALLRAHRMQEKASKVGFDWKDRSGVWTKVEEETAELHEAERSGSHAAIEEELGDLLFSLVNYARFLRVNPELALRKTVEKFEKRFRSLEKTARSEGKELEQMTLEEMDELWNKQKWRPHARRR